MDAAALPPKATFSCPLTEHFSLLLFSVALSADSFPALLWTKPTSVLGALLVLGRVAVLEEGLVVEGVVEESPEGG